MHKEPSSRPEFEGSGAAPSKANAELQPLQRLRQLAAEIRGAASRNDLEVVCQAATLLAPTLERCKQARDRTAATAGEAAQIALQTQALLQECETTLNGALRGIAAELRRLQQGKRSVSLMRNRAVAAARAGNLDTHR